LWLQSDGKQQDSYLQVRDELMGGLRQSGDVLVVGGSIHQSFTDDEFYFSATGRRLLGDGVGPEAANDITWETPDAISAFVGPALSGPTEPRTGTRPLPVHQTRTAHRSHQGGLSA